MKGGETQGKEEGAVAASSFAVAVGPWVAGERAGTEEGGGGRREWRRKGKGGVRCIYSKGGGRVWFAEIRGFSDDL